MDVGGLDGSIDIMRMRSKILSAAKCLLNGLSVIKVLNETYCLVFSKISILKIGLMCILCVKGL